MSSLRTQMAMAVRPTGGPGRAARSAGSTKAGGSFAASRMTSPTSALAADSALQGTVPR